MSDFDGNGPEMLEQRSADDREIDVALAGETRGTDRDPLSAFVSGVRTAAKGLPAPSTAMAAVLAAGFSTDNGNLPATAVSNVNGPAEQASGLPKWRTIKMRIRGFVAGLGIAGKIALGVSVAAAAAAGAGAAGVLPVTPHGHAHHRVTAAGVPASSTTTSTTLGHATSRRTRHGTHPAGTPAAYPIGPQVTPTTSAPSTNTDTATPDVTTPTTLYVPLPTTPPTEATTTTAVTTTTTAVPAGSQSIQLACSVTGPSQVTCTWTASPDPVARYALWRWTTGGNGSDYAPVYQTPDGLGFVDNSATPGTPYTYRVFTTRSDGSSGDFSNRAYLSCCN